MSRRKKSKKKRNDEVLTDPAQSREIWLAGQVSIAAILGVILLFLFINGVLEIVRHYIASATEGNYEERELEIVSYRRGPGDTAEDPLRIKGILHPGEIEIHTDDYSVSLMSFNNSDAFIQMAPAEEKVVGKRIKVKYFVGKIEDLRWWHPRMIHNSLPRSASGLILVWVFTSGYFVAMLSCFIYAFIVNRKFLEIANDD